MNNNNTYITIYIYFMDCLVEQIKAYIEPEMYDGPQNNLKHDSKTKDRDSSQLYASVR